MKKYLSPYKKQLIIGPLFKLIEAVMELLIPTMMVFVIDNGIAEGNTGYIIRMMIIMAVIAILGLCSALICQYSASIASQGFGTRLRDAMFEHITSMPDSQINKFGTPSLVNRITNDVNVLQQSVAMLIRLVIRAPFITIGSVVMAMLLDFRLSLVIVASIPLLVVAIYFIMSRSSRYYSKAQKKLDGISLAAKESLSGIRVIRSFDGTEREVERFEAVNSEYLTLSKRVSKISSLMNPVTSLIMNAAVIGVLWFGGLRVESGGMTQGEIIAFINYITYILNALVVVANLVVLFTKARVSYARVSEVLSCDTSVEFSGDTGVRSDSAVEFKNVSFKYGGAGGNALENITFKIARGSTAGIIGGTGSGKTTLVNLILRFYDCQSGEIYVGGRDIKSYPTTELRKKISAAMQKAVLFKGTIESNIRQGKHDASDSDILEAARVSQALEFIEKKPKKFGSDVERSGKNLSGGQKQRLSIARAIVSKPEILILDDCTSALDYATESRFRSALREYSSDMTVIIVSQRISGIKDADNIIVMDNGTILAQGTHSELLKNCEKYAEFARSQASSN